MTADYIIVGDEAWLREEWEADQARRERKRASKRAYRARPDVKERTRQYARSHRAYKREWMARYRASQARLVGSLHDLACFGPTRDTGCVCHKVRCYSKPRQKPMLTVAE
jgi:Lon protease-like protein